MKNRDGTSWGRGRERGLSLVSGSMVRRWGFPQGIGNAEHCRRPSSMGVTGNPLMSTRLPSLTSLTPPRVAAALKIRTPSLSPWRPTTSSSPQ